jgi:cephalosporin-C deacetylase-like acetyl esterase
MSFSFARTISGLFTCLFAPALALAASSWDGKTPAEYIVAVETDRPDALYHQGEKVTFKIELKHGAEPADGQVVYVISKDGAPPIQKGTLTLDNGRGAVDGTLAEPGFLHCEVTYKREKTSFTAIAAAGVDIDQIKPSMPAPADFDSFWADQKQKLASVPINPRLTPVPPPPDRPGIVTFDLQADCIGAPVSGYYARPADAKPKACPAILMPDAAGVRDSDLLGAARWAQKGCIVLWTNAHGIPNGKPKDYYNALANGDLKDYRTRGRESRETYYFLGMYLRVQRGLDFLTSQPEWDGRTLIIIGGSQGGAQSIVGAALDQRVTFIVAMNAAMCDHTGMVAGRIAGWPKLVPIDKEGKPDPAALETSRYFDCVNFAPRVKAQVFGWEGFLDVVAPPTGVYAAYNALPGKKEIVNDPSHGHATDGMKVWPTVAKVVLAHIAEQAKSAASAPAAR